MDLTTSLNVGGLGLKKDAAGNLMNDKHTYQLGLQPGAFGPSQYMTSSGNWVGRGVQHQDGMVQCKSEKDCAKYDKDDIVEELKRRGVTNVNLGTGFGSVDLTDVTAVKKITRPPLVRLSTPS